MRHKQVLYLTHDGLTDVLGQSQILPYLVGLAAKGFSIKIISCEKRRRLRELGSLVETNCLRFGITWIPISYYSSPPLIAPFLNVLRMRMRAMLEYKRNPYAIVHCRSYLTSLVGIYLKRHLGVKFVFDMRGFWADERKESGLWPITNPIYNLIYRYFKFKERKFLVEADHVVTLTELAAKEISTWGIKNLQITVIPTCADFSHFDSTRLSPDSKLQLREKLGITSSDYVLLYLGSWGSWYLTSQMINFFKLLKKKVSAIFLVLSPDAHLIPVEKDMIVREVTRSELPLYISIAQASVFFIQPTFSKKASAATKMGELMAMNIPIITNSGWGDVEAILSDTPYGILVNNFSESDLTHAIDQLLDIRSEVNLREKAYAYFDLSNGIDKYRLVYKSLNEVK